MLSKKKHVLWDWNGTLLDDAWLGMELANGLLAARNLPLLTPQRYQDLFDFPIRDYYARIGFDFAVESYELLADQFIARYERRRCECSLQPYARETITALRARGVRQSVLSAYRHETLVSIIAHHRLNDAFDLVHGLDNHFAAGKVELGKRLMTQLGADPLETVLIGDTTHDFEVARALGVECILVPGGHQNHHRLEACGVPVIGSLDEIRRMAEAI